MYAYFNFHLESDDSKDTVLAPPLLLPCIAGLGTVDIGMGIGR